MADLRKIVQGSLMTVSTAINKGENLLYQKVLGSRRFSNYWWASIVTMGASGFFLASLSSPALTDNIQNLPLSDIPPL